MPSFGSPLASDTSVGRQRPGSPDDVVGLRQHEILELRRIRKRYVVGRHSHYWGIQPGKRPFHDAGRDFAGELIFLAGKHYRVPLAAYAGARARVPMEGLGIGQQKAWLAAQLAEMER